MKTMKTLFLSIPVLVLSVSVIALPLTGASDDSSQSTQRKATESVQIAQARPGEQARPGKQARPDKTASKKQASGKADSRKENAKNASAAKSKRILPITPEIESEVGTFVREHHRELLDVLAHLKDNLPREYERAVRDLNRNRLRLQQIEGRDRYATELKLWKAQSRARLLGARVQMDDNASLRDALRETLIEIYDLRASILQRDRDRTAERLKKLNEQLKTLQKGRDENLQKQLTALTKPTSKRGKSVKTSTRTTKPTPSKKTPVKKSSNKTID